MDDILKRSGSELKGLVASGELKCETLVEAHLALIDAMDGSLQAFVQVDGDAALQAAKRADDRVVAGEDIGPLGGLTVAIKDVVDARGLPTTQGSLLMSRAPVDRDSISVARLKRAGAIVLGKTNTPEFGFGAVCTNKLCGPTCNPWDATLTSGGSSGGSAVAVTTGMTALAHGADFGGSVRTPASFTGCFGLRPTPGYLPDDQRALGWDTLATEGIITRTVEDAEHMLAVLSGADPHDPASQILRGEPGPNRRARLAASATLNDAFLIDPEVRMRFERAVEQVREIYAVAEAAPETDGADEAFRVLRAAQSWMKFRPLVEEHEAKLTESFVWNVRQGREITAEEYLDAQVKRTRAYRSFRKFFERYDILMLPAASVMPFPNAQGEVTEIDGHPCESIIDYLACTFLISLVGFPAISVPAPSLEGELPFGLQLVAQPHQESLLLRVASILETELGFAHHWPSGPALSA